MPKHPEPTYVAVRLTVEEATLCKQLAETFREHSSAMGSMTTAAVLDRGHAISAAYALEEAIALATGTESPTMRAMRDA
jgi:hypothetical protein